jgi:hypothetical protein
MKTMRQVGGEPDSSLATSSCIKMHHQGGVRHRLSRPFNARLEQKLPTGRPGPPCLVAHAPAHRCGQAEDTRARASNIEIGQFMIAGESTPQDSG